MTSSDHLDMQTPVEPQPRSMGWLVCWMVALLLALMFTAGICAGILSAHQEHDGQINAKFMLIMAVPAAIAGLIVWQGWRVWRKWDESQSLLPRRERQAGRWFMISLIIGIVLGAVYAFGEISVEVTNPDAPDGAIHPWVAAGMAFVMAVVVPWLAWKWHNAIDEHEEAAYRFAAMMAGYTYLTIYPAWWILNKGGIAPAVDHELIFSIVVIFWIVIWLWRKNA